MHTLPFIVHWVWRTPGYWMLQLFDGLCSSFNKLKEGKVLNTICTSKHSRVSDICRSWLNTPQGWIQSSASHSTQWLAVATIPWPQRCPCQSRWASCSLFRCQNHDIPDKGHSLHHQGGVIPQVQANHVHPLYCQLLLNHKVSYGDNSPLPCSLQSSSSFAFDFASVCV